MPDAALPDPTTTPGRPAGVLLYWRAVGVLLAALAALGILLVAVDRGALIGAFLRFQAGQNALLAALAVAAVFLGFSNADPHRSRRAVLAFSAFNLTLALLGVLTPDLLGLGELLAVHFEPGDALLHLLLGASGLYVALR